VRLATAAALVALLGAAAAPARNAARQMHVVANVVSSARLQTRAAPGGAVDVRYRAFGGVHGGAVLVHQRSGAPVALDGAVLPRDASAAVVVTHGPLPISGSGPAEVVATLFPDGAPPDGVRTR
jgi:hypothetical protein